MFKKFKDSPYTKAGVVLVLCGAVLIVFHDWISRNQFSVGYEKINSTLAPVYIGIILAFILCPVYNACVKYLYAKMVESAQRPGFSVGATLVHDDRRALTVDSEERCKLFKAARAFASAVCIVLVVGLSGLLVYFVVPQLVQTIIELVNTLPQRLNSLSAWLEVHVSHFPVLARWVNNVANAGASDIIKWAQEHILDGNAMNIANMISSGVTTAVKYVLNAVIGLLIMIYLLNYKEKLFAICRKIVAATCGQKRRDRLYEFAGIVNETFIGFIVGRIIDSFIIGVLTYIVLKIADIPFALMISVIVGVTNIIPFFGPFIGAVPSIILLLTEDPMDALYFAIIILIIQQIDGNIIGPKVMGNAIGISSFWVLIAVLVGGGLFGFGGMVLGVPVFAVIYRYIDKLTIRQLKQREKPTATSDYVSLEAYGIDEKEIAADPVQKKSEPVIRKIRKRKKKE
ncbi:MAG: AI-2E family transporter [Mogibacterium sp.]|nr:AI-2E family transporter [Mogibacterium sp.]